MALPFSRNTTYGPESPVLANDLNQIQDCIAGFRTGSIPIAAPERSIGIQAMAFQHKTNLPTPTPQGSATQWTLFTDIFAPILLPDGIRIKRVSYRARRNSATGDASGIVSLFNDANDIGLALDTTSIATIPGPGVVENFTTPDINYVIQPGDSIQVRVLQAANNSLLFYRATVYFDLPV